MKPWYMYPHVTCKVMNRISASNGDLNRAMEMLWSKVESFYNKHGKANYNMRLTV